MREHPAREKCAYMGLGLWTHQGSDTVAILGGDRYNITYMHIGNKNVCNNDRVKPKMLKIKIMPLV
jgi:hypothetical protein